MICASFAINGYIDLPFLASCACVWAVFAYCLFEGLASNKAAAEDADATFDDTALALDVATGFPATTAPEDWVMEAGIVEPDPDEIVPLLPVMALVPDEAVLDCLEAERLDPSVPVTDKVVMERPEVDELDPIGDPDAEIEEKVPVTEGPPVPGEDAVAD